MNRVVGITRLEHYRQQLQVIHSSPKYQLTDSGQWEAVPFPGTTIVAPPSGEDPVNQAFYQQLHAIHQTLVDSLPPDLLIPLPSDSLHVTLADLLWADTYVQAREQPGFEEKLNGEIADVFQTYPHSKNGPLRFQTLGYMVMPRALGICLVPDTEAAYERLMLLRRSLYQQQTLLGLGIEQHYHLTLHITLGYFGRVPDDLDRESLSDRLAQLSQTALVPLPEFVVQRAELRRFDNMTSYEREPGWPVLEF